MNSAGGPIMDGRILSGTRTLEQPELFARAARAASGFTSVGIAEGDAVALVLRNDFAFFEATFGAGLIGAYTVPVNWHFTADEVGYIVRDCGARAVVVHADLLPDIAEGLPLGTHVLIASTPPEISAAYGIAPERREVAAGYTDWTAWLARQPAWTAP